MPQNLNNPRELPEDFDDLDVPPSRFSVMTGTLVVVGILTLAIFTGVIWYAYNAGVNLAGQEALPIVKAEPGESKVRPDNPGGENFAHQDKTVYDKIDGNEDGVEQLLPGSEEPKEKPRIINPYNNEMPAEGQPKVVRIPPPDPDSKLTAPSEAPEVAAPEIPDPMGRAKTGSGAGERVAAVPAPEVTTEASGEADAADQPSDPEGEPDAGESAPDAETAPNSPVQAEPPEAAPAVTTVTSGGKGYVLQLGAFRTVEAADAGWKLLATRHAGVLGALEHFITPADLGDRGRFFRLQAGPFPERGAANDQCAALKSAGVDCLVAVR